MLCSVVLTNRDNRFSGLIGLASVCIGPLKQECTTAIKNIHCVLFAHNSNNFLELLVQSCLAVVAHISEGSKVGLIINIARSGATAPLVDHINFEQLLLGLAEEHCISCVFMARLHQQLILVPTLFFVSSEK
jgi:hypothetical protein